MKIEKIEEKKTQKLIKKVFSLKFFFYSFNLSMMEILSLESFAIQKKIFFLVASINLEKLIKLN